MAATRRRKGVRRYTRIKEFVWMIATLTIRKGSGRLLIQDKNQVDDERKMGERKMWNRGKVRLFLMICGKENEKFCFCFILHFGFKGDISLGTWAIGGRVRRETAKEREGTCQTWGQVLCPGGDIWKGHGKGETDWLRDGRTDRRTVSPCMRLSQG